MGNSPTPQFTNAGIGSMVRHLHVCCLKSRLSRLGQLSLLMFMNPSDASFSALFTCVSSLNTLNTCAQSFSYLVWLCVHGVCV